MARRKKRNLHGFDADQASKYDDEQLEFMRNLEKCNMFTMHKSEGSRSNFVQRYLDANGSLELLANTAEVDINSVREYVDSDKRLQVMLSECSQVFIERAESALLELVNDRDFKAIKFYLEAKAKHLGYTSDDTKQVRNTHIDKITETMSLKEAVETYKQTLDIDKSL